MKTNILILFFLFFIGNIYSQSETSKKFIVKIEKEILDKKIKKIYFEKVYPDKVIIYLKKDTPIFIQLENHETFNNHYTNGEIKEVIHLKIIKIYIKNWKKKKYVIDDPSYFELDRAEIENIIANSKKIK